MSPLSGYIPHRPEDAARYIKNGWWENITLGDMLDESARLHPDKEALVDDRVRLTWSQLRETVDKTAVGLLNLGIKNGDCVLLQLPDWAEYLIAFFALQKIGATAVLLLPRHAQLEINNACRMTKAKAWIVPENYRKIAYRPIIDEVMKSNPWLEHIISVRGRGDKPFVGFKKLQQSELNRKNLAKLAASKPDARDVAFILPTGGTTGLPKTVPRTHNDAVCEAKFKATSRLQTGDDICLVSVPLEHNLGMAAIDGTIALGGTLVFLDSTRPEDFCETVQREKATRAPLVPTMLARLVSFAGLDKYDLSSLEALYVGGARTPPEVILATHKKLGRIYLSAFGMSEGSGCTIRLDDSDDTVLNTVGRPCCPYDEFKVVDGDGRELPRNKEGELMVKGPCLFSGYLNNPEENKRAFTSEGYFLTGDIAVISDAGIIRITGRKKDIIIRGGENIVPADIEALIGAHPDVEEVAVVGMPDADLGERACAYIVPRGNAKPTIEDIASFLRGRGASVLQLPERVELIREIPKTQIGKPDKKALREDIKKRLATTHGELVDP